MGSNTATDGAWPGKEAPKKFAAYKITAMIVPPAMQTQINLSSYTLRLCSQIIDNCRDRAVIGLRLARKDRCSDLSLNFRNCLFC